MLKKGIKAGKERLRGLRDGIVSTGNKLSSIGQGIDAAGDRLGGTPVNFARSGVTNQGGNVTTNVEVNTSVPEGTTTGQAKQISDTAKRGIEAAADVNNRNTIKANPVVE